MASLRLITTVLAVLVVCVTASPEDESSQQWEARTAVSRSNLDFTRDLFKVMSQNPGNLFFSPTSIHIILAMTSLGARGDTAQEMVQGLHLPSDQQKVKDGFRSLMTSLQGSTRHNFVTTKVANRIFTDSRFTPMREFMQAARNDFHSDSEGVDFQHKHEEVRAHINSWVLEQTENKIRDLLPVGSIDSSTLVVLVNALFFKGSWASDFNKQSTTPQPFYVRQSLTKTVPMMYQVASRTFRYADSEQLDAEILELPYQGGEVSMLVILPKNKFGLQDVESKLSQMSFSDLMAIEKSHPRVHLYLPKFKIEQTEGLNSILSKMGMSKMFTPAADFGGLVGNNQTLTISAVVHKAFIEVDEDGTVAAASTVVFPVPVFDMIGPPPTEMTFKADHPFLFLLVKNTFRPVNQQFDHTILFMGRCADPSS